MSETPRDRGWLWTGVAAGGLVTGLFPITGPIAWWQAGRLRKQEREAGRPVPDTVTLAWALGIGSTAVAALSFLFLAALIALQVVLGVAFFAAG